MVVMINSPCYKKKKENENITRWWQRMEFTGLISLKRKSLLIRVMLATIIITVHWVASYDIKNNNIRNNS